MHPVDIQERRIGHRRGHCGRFLPILTLWFASLCSVANAADRPNILWLTCEDNNVNWVGCYGNPHADTPNIDKLATEGFQYMHCYANAPVCAPSRSTWITGVHALSMGTHPMRSRYPIPHDTIKYYPDLLKKAGYYVGNAKKTDYNIGGRDDKSRLGHQQGRLERAEEATSRSSWSSTTPSPMSRKHSATSTTRRTAPTMCGWQSTIRTFLTSARTTPTTMTR